jgi:futalosine hydrolase
MILVICAVTAELRGFARDGVDVVAVGVGPVEAAIGASRALLAKPYEFAVNAGIGGGFAGRADIGDAAAVTHDHYVEIGREDRGPLALPGGLALVASAAGDTRLLECLMANGAVVRIGCAVTSATITTSAARADALAQLYAPVTESMEGFAVLRAAAVAGVPAIELRGISNVVGDRATSGWDFRAGSTAAVGALNALLDGVKAQR